MRQEHVFIAAETERITGHDLLRFTDVSQCLLQLQLHVCTYAPANSAFALQKVELRYSLRLLGIHL